MKHLIFVYPGDLTTPTGGYAYDRRMIEGLERLGWQIQLISLGDGYPFIDQTQRDYARNKLLSLAKGVPMVIDGLALGVLPDLAPEIASRHPLIALIHHPLAFEYGLKDPEVKHLKQSETQALKNVVGVIANSPATARDLHQHYGMNLDRVRVVLPGTDLNHRLEPRSQMSGDDCSPINLLSVGSIIPRKGFHDLIPALEPLIDLPWTLSIAGDTSHNPEAYERLMMDIKYFHLEDRVTVLGVVTNEDLENLYAKADIFVLASLFEGYGMVYAEAMAHGLPIIATTGGAIPDTVPQEAGLLVAPGDIPALTMALKTLILDPLYRAQLASGALQAARLQPTWEDAIQNFATALNHLVPS
ncbi:glycosyl transferase family 1 [Polynucleobacter sp. SHI8]|uniref:glycosyltransferase family 4 protein n=1 Tax=unclassified Polynucleobacter TaxID=2640945 RepID=UPI00248F7F5F|nr:MULTISPECIES: glycosyltransferase family 4 protein [unclassified Polynucleobacter]BDW10429.1 glycosyl transferase family 1 [Polynucleobacter sp. SHI2]BDW12875.1 glycosyl transferase family 1 [Polynucleobacter sp. SHI8]